MQYYDKDSKQTFVVGMDVYFIFDNCAYDRLTEENENKDQYDSVCEVCGEDSISATHAMVECDYCIRNFHIKCLKTAPDSFGNWMCPVCTGEAEPSQSACSLPEIFCRTEGIVKVGRIKRLWKCQRTTFVDLVACERAQTFFKANPGEPPAPREPWCNSRAPTRACCRLGCCVPCYASL